VKSAVRHIKSYWYKYLLETLVIVVGVLGAFALNNWNESKVRLRTEKEVLDQISSDLQRTVDSVERSSSSHKQIIATAMELLDHMAGDEPYDEAISYQLAESFFYTQLDNDLGGYKTMQSHGVDIIANQDLRNQIIHHFGQRLAVTKRRESILFDFADKVKLYECQKYFKHTFEVENFFVGEETATGWGDIRLRSEPRDYEVLRRSEEYRYHLKTYMETVKWYEVGIQVFGRETGELVDAIGEEVTSRFE